MKEDETSSGKAVEVNFERYLTALRGRVGEAKYSSWFVDLGIGDVTQECVTLTTGSKEKRDMLDTRFLPMLAETWRREIGPIDKMRLTVQKKLRAHAAKINAQEDQRESAAASFFDNTKSPQKAAKLHNGAASQSPAASSYHDIATALDPRRTFETFAIGNSNRIGWAAAQQAPKRGHSRELIYFYGQSGVGKTHLLQAIAHEWLKDDTLGPAAYVTYSNLINACVGAVWSNSTSDLHKALLENSLLSFDDVHFLEGKNRTQEELLIMIDAALDNGKQVVIAGELPPAKLAENGINQRLSDRLAGGLCVPIHGGDEELRLAVLKKRIEQSPSQCSISEEVVQFIARNFTQSMRETIGALNQLILMFGHDEVTVELGDAKSILKARLADSHKVRTLDDAIAAGAEAFGLKLEDMTCRAQPQRLVRARHAVVWCAREVLKESFPRIGKALKRDHTTAMSSYRRAQALLERDKQFQDAVKRIREALED